MGKVGEARWTYRQRAGIAGSVLTTGGGLVFVSDDARRFRAFDADSGEILWEQILNSSAGGFPITYSVDGVQYIAIAAGGGAGPLGQPGGRLVVLAVEETDVHNLATAGAATFLTYVWSR